jgi:hypothetical protein
LIRFVIQSEETGKISSFGFVGRDFNFETFDWFQIDFVIPRFSKDSLYCVLSVGSFTNQLFSAAFTAKFSPVHFPKYRVFCAPEMNRVTWSIKILIHTYCLVFRA